MDVGFITFIQGDCMFLYVLQTYYVPIITLIIFTVMVITDKLFSRRIKKLFLWEIGLMFLMIIINGADFCFREMSSNSNGWILRTMTTLLNFGLSPCPPMVLVLIYETKESKKFSRWFYAPLLFNMAVSLLSIRYGLIFHVSNENVYTRGPLFFVPFAVCGFYFLSLIFCAAKQRDKPNRKAETAFLTVFLGLIGLAIVLEIIFHIQLLVWSLSEASFMLYFLLLMTQKILYDPLTGTYNRIAYEKQLEKINGRSVCTIAMIDLNNLKNFNDRFGHSSGDEAICGVTASILKAKGKHMHLYRYGGDEFVLLSCRLCGKEMERVLELAQDRCEAVQGICLSFSYGVAEYRPGDDLNSIILNADADMYRNKRKFRDI